MIHDQFRRERVFERDGRLWSSAMRDLVLDHVTVRRNWAQPAGVTHDTLFREVGIMPFERTLTPPEEALMELSRGPVCSEPDEFWPLLADALIDHIIANWRPEAFHILWHSSGWDSRILSLLLWRLYRERGDGWLGRVLLVAFGPEADVAAQIIQTIGWPLEWAAILFDPADWLYPLFDMRTAGPLYNGAHVTVPVTRYSVMCWLREVGLVPDTRDIQALSGWGSDYFTRVAHRGELRRRARGSYYAATSIGIASAHEEILPWLGYGVVRLIAERAPCDVFSARPAFVRYLDAPAGAIPRWTGEWPTLPRWLMESVCEQYHGSWYGCYAAPGAERAAVAIPNWSYGQRVVHSPWWSHWTAACYCEWLLREGVKLAVEG